MKLIDLVTAVIFNKMARLKYLGCLCAVAVSVVGSIIPRALVKRDIPETVLFTAPADYTSSQVLYARTVQLSDGSILATWENYSPEPPPVYFPIYRSTDSGATFQNFSTIQDQVNGWGLRYQPFLYELPADWAGYKAGTIIAAGNSIPTDLSLTKIDVYYSTDCGLTWTFASSVANGGEATPENGKTPVWEPFLLLFEDQLICFYSDQRDPLYGQKLTHQTTKDLVSWDPTVDDVTYPEYEARPGMTIVSHLPNDQWIITYEYGEAPDVSFAVYYKLADSPLEFGPATGYPVITTDGVQPVSSPYNIWVPGGPGGDNGTIIVNGMSSGDLYLNTELAAPGSRWTAVPSGQSPAYTRSLTALDDYQSLLIMGGDMLDKDPPRTVTYSVKTLKDITG